MKAKNKVGRPISNKNTVRVTTVAVEPEVIEACQEKHGSLPNALRVAAKAKATKK